MRTRTGEVHVNQSRIKPDGRTEVKLGMTDEEKQQKEREAKEAGKKAYHPADEQGVVYLSALATAFLGVLWAYHGWMNIAPIAEEVHHPQRNLPLSLLGGVLTVAALYVSANVAYSLLIPRDEMADLKNTTVAAEFGRRLFGPAGVVTGSMRGVHARSSA